MHPSKGAFENQRQSLKEQDRLLKLAFCFNIVVLRTGCLDLPILIFLTIRTIVIERCNPHGVTRSVLELICRQHLARHVAEWLPSGDAEQPLWPWRVNSRVAGISQESRPLGAVRVRALLEVARDELGHLEHTHLIFAVEDGLQVFISIDQGLLLLVLQPMLANVCPKLLGQFGSRKRSSADNFGQQIIRLHRFHEGRAGFSLGFGVFSHARVVNPHRKDCNNIFYDNPFPGTLAPAGSRRPTRTPQARAGLQARCLLLERNESQTQIA